MKAQDTLLWLITTEEEWLEAFKLMCRYSPVHLRAQVWQFSEELKDRGYDYEHEDLEDTLFELAHSLLPDSPAAEWDTEWAAEKARALKEAATASREAMLEAGRRLSSVDGTAEAARLAAREQTHATF